MSSMVVTSNCACEDFASESAPTRKPVQNALKSREKMPEHVHKLVIGAAQQIRMLPRSRRVQRWGTPEISKAVIVEMRRRRVAWFMALTDDEAEAEVDEAIWDRGDNGHRAFHTLKTYIQSGVAEAIRLQRGAHLEADVA